MLISNEKKNMKVFKRVYIGSGKVFIIQPVIHCDIYGCR